MKKGMKAGKGFKAIFNKNSANALLTTLAGTITYLAVPTIAGLNGALGAMVGLVASILVGGLTGRPLVALGGALTFLTHAIYIYVNPILTKQFGKPIFGWSEQGFALQATSGNTGIAGGAATPTTVQSLANTLQPGARMLPVGGEQVVGYPGGSMADVPVVDMNHGMTLRDVPMVGKAPGASQNMTIRI